MKYFRSLFIIPILAVALQAESYELKKTAPFDILQESYDACEAHAMDELKKEAVQEYIGCSADVSHYDVNVKVLRIIDRALTEKTCGVEAEVDVTSSYLEERPYYLGSWGVICQNIDTSLEQEDAFWNNFELGIYGGLSGSQDVIEMTSSNTKIDLEYDSTMMVGLVGSYSHRIFESQYIGGKLFVAKGFESYTEEDPNALVRNDGVPSILRAGLGGFYGYRYHLKTDFTIGANYLMDNLTRSYTNNTYKATVNKFNVEAGVGYLVLPYLKVWGTVASDMSANVGISWVFGNTASKKIVPANHTDATVVQSSESNEDAQRQKRLADEAIKQLDEDTDGK